MHAATKPARNQAGLDAALQSLLGTLSEARRPVLRQAMSSHKSA
jgi:hypothetical protein